MEQLHELIIMKYVLIIIAPVECHSAEKEESPITNFITPSRQAKALVNRQVTIAIGDGMKYLQPSHRQL